MSASKKLRHKQDPSVRLMLLVGATFIILGIPVGVLLLVVSRGDPELTKTGFFLLVACLAFAATYIWRKYVRPYDD